MPPLDGLVPVLIRVEETHPHIEARLAAHFTPVSFFTQGHPVPTDFASVEQDTKIPDAHRTRPAAQIGVLWREGANASGLAGWSGEERVGARHVIVVGGPSLADVFLEQGNARDSQQQNGHQHR